jgi:hypothetical protein
VKTLDLLGLNDGNMSRRYPLGGVVMELLSGVSLVFTGIHASPSSGP